MQLKANHKTPLRLALAAATATLLGTPPTVAQEESDNNPWQINTAILIYKEDDGRVEAIEPVVALKKDFGDEHILDVKVAADTLTGASPNGAVPSTAPQTFTSPSGKSTTVTPPGETPYDESFRDLRTALGVQWEQPWQERHRISVGGNLSNEHDFQSVSANASIATDFNNKNTTLSVGLGLENDKIKAVGENPQPLSTYGSGNKIGQQSRRITDLLVGVTQVMHRRWLTQVNLSAGKSSGDHNDPYKIVSIVDSGGVPTSYVYESRPDSRSRQSLFWQNKVHLERDVIDASYRFFRDDWGIRAHTLDFKYRWLLAPQKFLEPHVRWHSQRHANFFRHFLPSGSLPEHVSADPRLASFNATTIGLKYGQELGRNSEWSIRLERYVQRGDAHPPEAIGQLRQQNLFPAVRATLLSASYSFEF